ncbi:MAG: hypothetical protein LBG61_06550 [Burkholderiales bacterium]|jgi:pilus assembly protein FimV|nr:hypothetical protein [Burkholderiales bacterium]
MQRNNIFKISVLAGCLFLAQGAWALGLGQLKVQSTLGHPLKAEIELLGTPDEFSDLTATIASPAEYQMKDLTYLGAFSSATITVTPRSKGTSVLSISTTQSINEPYLDLLIRVVWSSGQALREYTLLLDPPRPGQAPPPPPPTQPPVLPPEEGFTPGPQPQAQPQQPPATTVPPQRQQPAQPAQPAQPPQDGSHRVQKGETLSSIVATYKPNEVTMQQALVAFYEANRGAFIHGNMNLIRSGAELRLPDESAYQSMTAQEARQTVRIQNEEWRNYIKAASVEPKSVDTDSSNEPTKVTTTTQAPTTRSEGTVTLTSPNEMSSREDQRIADANRIRELEEENDRLRKIAIQAEELKKLQDNAANQPAQPSQQPAAQQPPAQPAPQPVPPVVEAPVTPPPAQPAPVVTPPVQQAPAVTPPAVTPPPEQQPPAVTPPPKPPRTAVTPPKPVEEPSFLSRVLNSSFLMIVGLVLLLAFLIAYVLYRRKKREEESSDSLFTEATSSMTASSTSLSTRAGVASPSVAQPRDRAALGMQSSNSILSEFSREGLGNIETGEVDPLAEADVYLAYGRAQQAEEILHDALKKDSQRQDVYLKLLEVLADQKKSAEFEKIASRLYALSSGQGEYWQRAKVLGERLLPGNPRFSAGGGFAQQTATPKTSHAADPRGFAPMEAPSVAQSIAQAAGRAVERRSQQQPTPSIDEGDSLLNAPSSNLPEMSEAHFSLEPLGGQQDDLGVDIDLEELSRFRNFGKTEESVAIDTGGPDLTKTQPATKSGSDLADLDLSFDAGAANKSEGYSAMTAETDGDWNDVATKLDLARAYQATGDSEACREILQEVLREGDEQQKSDAKAILQSLQGE